jgi:ATP-binding cassette, subfamily B, multidrug efflux pump
MNGQAPASDEDLVPVSARLADLRLLTRLLGYLKTHRSLLVVALLLYPLDTITVVLPPYLVRQMLDLAIPARDLGLLTTYAIIYLAALLFEYAVGLAAQLAMGVLGQRAMRSLRRDLYAHVQTLSAAYFDRTPVGRVLTRVTNDVEALAEIFSSGAIATLGDLLTLAAVVGAMLWLDVRMTLFAFLIVPPLVVLVVVFRVFARRAYRAIRQHLSRMNTYLSEHLAAMSVVQAFRQESRTQREFLALNEDYRDANRDGILADSLLYSAVEALGTAAVALLIWYGAVDFTSGAVGAGTFVAFMQYIRRFFVPIRDLSTKYTVIQSAFAAAERCLQLLDEPTTIVSPPTPCRLTRLERGLAFEAVWFSYRQEPNDRDWVLRGLDLKVGRGERVALVGATGAGKSSILKLLNRTYDVQRGRVVVDGTNVGDLELESLRRLFAVVLQDVHLFTGTIMDNLMLGSAVAREDVRRAAEAVQAAPFIARLPRGFDTSVAELGANFSGGERQLLAFARALARDPQVLVLDEATSSVDSETEARIQEALSVLLEDRTAIIVAHRLSTIRRVDRIIVLSQGRVVEEGNHEALMAKGGLYRNLVDLQFNASQT